MGPIGLFDGTVVLIFYYNLIQSIQHHNSSIFQLFFIFSPYKRDTHYEYRIGSCAKQLFHYHPLFIFIRVWLSDWGSFMTVHDLLKLTLYK